MTPAGSLRGTADVSLVVVMATISGIVFGALYG